MHTSVQHQQLRVEGETRTTTETLIKQLFIIGFAFVVTPVRRLVRWFLQTWLIPLILLLIDVALRRFRLTSASPGSCTWDPGGAS